MADSDPKVSPIAEPEAPENSNVFSYDVSAQAGTTTQQQPNPVSPLAAG